MSRQGEHNLRRFVPRPCAGWLAAAIQVFAALPAAAQETPLAAADVASSNASPVEASEVAAIKKTKVIPLAEVTVTARRLDLLGTAQTASDGVVSQEELELTPAYRPGQLLETVPGLIVSLHSGEGKANQYLLRGYNLDHGTDLATFIDGVPINQPTHAHGQGYTDLNILIPELAGGLSYTKGTYHADVGDFGGVGSVRLDYVDSIPDQVLVTTGTLDFQRMFAAGTRALAGGKLLAAAELQHYDGPFVVPDDQRKENLLMRYSRDEGNRGYSLTGSLYHGLSTNTTDLPQRAIAEGLVPNRFGSLDGSDGVRANRGNLSFQYHQVLGGGRLAANAFYSHNELHLYNNFTHFLFDPVNGDQEEQFEFRDAAGGEASYMLPAALLSIDNEFLFGVLARYDDLTVGRNASADRMPLPAFAGKAPASFTNRDRVFLLTTAAYLQATTHWTPWFRSVLGFREEYARGLDTDLQAVVHEASAAGAYSNSGESSRTLPQPKGSLIYQPAESLEFYLSAGRGFHSADLRGVNQTKVPALNLPPTPFLASLVGEEAGLRAEVQGKLTFTAALYNLDQQSETIIDPDIGADSPGPPSRRDGYELNVTYKIRRWLELYASYSGDHTRFRYAFDDGTGHLGTYITDAPLATGSLALYLQDLGPWSGGLEYRYLGNYPLASGPCADTAVQHDFPHSGPNGAAAPSCAYAVARGLTTGGELGGKGFGEFNLDLGYAFVDGWSASLGVYNLLDSKRNAAEFTYVDRLQAEVSSYPDGRADTHLHPLEPVSARFTVSRRFGF